MIKQTNIWNILRWKSSIFHSKTNDKTGNANQTSPRPSLLGGLSRQYFITGSLAYGLDQCSYSTLGPVNAQMGDRFRTSKPHATEPATQVNSARAIPLWVGEKSTSESRGVK